MLDLLVGRGEELALRDHPDRNLLVHRLHPIRIERLALGRIDLARRLVDELIDLVGLPAPLVRPRRALRRAGTVPDRRRDGRIAAILVPARGEVEVPVAVDGRQRAGDVELDDLDLDADIGEGLLDEGREQRHVLAVLDRHELEREADAVGAALVARLVEQRLGLLLVEGVGRLAAGDRRPAKRTGSDPSRAWPGRRGSSR